MKKIFSLLALVLFINLFTYQTQAQTAVVNINKTSVSLKELIQKNIEEFSRLQDYMIDSEKGSTAYKKMKRRYTELKVILTASGINLTELDFIKE